MALATAARSFLTFPVGISAGILVLLALVLPLPWVSWGSEVDIRSGRVRETVWVVGIVVQSRVKETWVSEVAEPIGPPEWHYAVTRDWWNHVSPHYRLHGAVHQIHEVEKLSEGLSWEEESKREAAETLLRLWQAGSYWEAEPFVLKLGEMLAAKQEGPAGTRRVTVMDLPAE